MMTIREHLPGLKTMDMAITGSPTPLLFDDSWLPCIRLLAYGDLPDTSHLDYFGDRKGLVSFSIIDATYAFPLDDIAPLIIYHHETLQLLAFRTLLNTTNARKLMDAMHKDQDIEFKQLKILQVFTLLGQYEIDAIHSFCNFIHWVIERAPFLHTVELKGFVLCRSSLEALAKCIHLRHVDFRVPGIQRPEDYDTLVAEFLRDHVDYMADKGGSRLESVQVQLYEAMPTLINAIQGLKCLTSFHLTTTGLESERFKQLFDSLYQGCPGLQTLFIWTRGAIPNPVLYQIGGLSNLRFLTMVGDLKDSQAGVLSLQRCRHLERIIHYRPIDDDIRSMLLKSNPQLVISSP